MFQSGPHRASKLQLLLIASNPEIRSGAEDQCSSTKPLIWHSSVSCSDSNAVFFGLYPISHSGTDKLTITKNRRNMEDKLMACLASRHV